MITFIRRNDTPNKKGEYAVRMRVNKERLRKYFTLKMFAGDDAWDVQNERFIIMRYAKTEEQKAENERRKQYNYNLERYKVRAQEIIDGFERERVDWTLNQFEDAFLNKTKQGKVKAFLEAHIQTLKETGHIGNADCYSAILRVLEGYDSKFGKRVFSEIDIKYVKGFDVYLQKRGCCGNSRKYYFKSLRAILNKAIQEKEATDKSYPFGRGGFQVGSLEEETAKRYLKDEYMQKLKNCRSIVPRFEYARQLFLFSYYCYGMSFVDMAYLRGSNVEKHDDGEYIVYKRHKIKHHKKVKPIRIKITDEIRALLGELCAGSPTMDDFLVPIVSIAGYEGEQLHTHIRNRYHKYNNYLAELAKEFGITDIKLTTYVARHTMAMTLQKNKTPREVISQMLGHSDLSTTNTYLDCFDSSVINEAAKVL